MTLHLNAIDISIIVATLAATIFVGMWSGRRVKSDSAKGYFLASGRMPWWIIGSAFVSTSVSSEQIIGTVGAAYSHGMGIANWEWFTLPIYTLLVTFFIPIYLKNKITTVSELLNRRYGPLCADVYSWVMLVAYVLVFLTPVLYGSSLAVSALTGYDFYLVLWLTVIAVGAYSIKGGLGAVMWTDAIQCLFLIAGGLILFFVSLTYVPGGWTAMQAAAPERFHLYHPATDKIAPFLGLIMGAAGVFLFYNAGNQVMVQRVLAARTPWDGMMGIIFSGFINLVRPLVTCFIGFIVYHWTHVMNEAPVLENADMAFPFALQTFAPSWGLRGIVLAGFMAAVMSTVSALSNSAATVFSLDVYHKYFRRNASDAHLVLVGRAASFVALMLAGLCAPLIARLGGIFEFFQTGVTYLATPFISVILLGILWRRANYAGAIAGIFGGLVIQISLAVANARMSWGLHWLYIACMAQGLTMCLAAIVSVASRDTRTPETDAFVWSPGLMRNLQIFEQRPWYRSLILWFSVNAFAWAGVYYYFW
jgi:SSS family solute:Na+ symporter